jgi:alkanesulfonate monooxygenase SsuD/methylene tetrahydromethanopterin reductase-like flavin-dependent oxidoreductase (luciferase family)
MQYGFVIPGGEIRVVSDLAHEAEECGWDGVFIPDCIQVGDGPTSAQFGADPWVTLAAMAMRTERVRLGTMLTPLSRRRPWKVARETTSIDRLSNGRLILPVGLGALDDAGFGKVGEPTDRKTRAALLDESLAILDGLWSGELFSYQGEHYKVADLQFLPRPVQQPRIPVWVAAAWPRPKSMERELRWDGLLPIKLTESGEHTETTPADTAAMRSYVKEHRTGDTPFDIVTEGVTPGDDPAAARAKVQPFAEAGATWWMESMWSAPNGPDEIRARIKQGPPRV